MNKTFIIFSVKVDSFQLWFCCNSDLLIYVAETMEDIFLVHLTENKLLRCEYIYINIYNELVELSGPFFITQSSGFDEGVVSVFDS